MLQETGTIIRDNEITIYNDTYVCYTTVRELKWKDHNDRTSFPVAK